MDPAAEGEVGVETSYLKEYLHPHWAACISSELKPAPSAVARFWNWKLIQLCSGLD